MATNPMQRKARNSFLLGMLLMLLISGIIIGFLVFLLVKESEKLKEKEMAQTQVYVLNTSVASGQIITSDMLSLQTVPTITVPANAFNDLSTFMNYSLVEKDTGNEVGTDQNGLFINDNGTKLRVTKEGDKYYKIVNNQKQYVEFLDVPLVAKVNMAANSIVTLEFIARSDEIANSDLRLQEYNMLNLPVKLNVDDYIDIRLMLPNGLEYIVISKKRVLDIMENTIWLRLSQEEILTMSNAIVEAYIMSGSKLYVDLYVEPGMQNAATPTYAVSQEILSLIENDPNIRQTAKLTLFNNYNTQAMVNQRQNVINAELEKNSKDIESKIQEENTQRKELREKYLQELAEASGLVY